MDANKLSWEQIKELAEIAMENGNDFTLKLYTNGDFSLDISKHDYIIPSITTNPTITWNNSTTPLSCMNLGDEPNNPYKVTC